MTRRLFSIGIGATVAAAALATAFVTAQDTNGQGQPGAPPAVQGQAPPPPRQVRPGRGPGSGQSIGPRTGRSAPMMGPGRGAGRGPQGPGLGPGRGLASLDLTDDQRVKITDLQRATRDQAAPLEDELEFTRRTLHRELFADKRDNAKVTSLTVRIATLEKQLADLHVKTTTAVADLLTPEQRETMRLRGSRRGGTGGGPGRPRLGRGGVAGPGPGGGGASPE